MFDSMPDLPVNPLGYYKNKYWKNKTIRSLLQVGFITTLDRLEIIQGQIDQAQGLYRAVYPNDRDKTLEVINLVIEYCYHVGFNNHIITTSDGFVKTLGISKETLRDKIALLKSLGVLQLYTGYPKTGGGVSWGCSLHPVQERIVRLMIEKRKEEKGGLIC